MSMWDAQYAARPAWDIGAPQRAFVELTESGALTGRLLDLGCGTGEATILAARCGAAATGVDISARAIAIAIDKAARRGVDAHFEVADVLVSVPGPEPFDVAIDSGTFHLFGPGDRRRYLGAVAAALRPGGLLHVLAVAPDPTRRWGPPGLSREELAESFAAGWSIESVTPAAFEVSGAVGVPPLAAWLVTARRGAEQ